MGVTENEGVVKKGGIYRILVKLSSLYPGPSSQPLETLNELKRIYSVLGAGILSTRHGRLFYETDHFRHIPDQGVIDFRHQT